MKTNIRNIIKGSLNVVVAMLNKDFRESAVDYAINNAKANASNAKTMMANSRLYPKLVMARASVTNVFNLIEMHTFYEVEHLTSPAARQSAAEGINLILQASGWTLEEFNAAKAQDSSSLSILDKMLIALNNPKGDSVIAEGREILLEAAAPFMESHFRLQDGLQEFMEEVNESFESASQDDKYTVHDGKVMLKEDVHAYQVYKTKEYLTCGLHLNEENAAALTSADGTKYELVRGVVELLTRFKEDEISWHSYNEGVAKAIQDAKTMAQFEADMGDLQKLYDEGKVTPNEYATRISKLQKKYGL